MSAQKISRDQLELNLAEIGGVMHDLREYPNCTAYMIVEFVNGNVNRIVMSEDAGSFQDNFAEESSRG